MADKVKLRKIVNDEREAFVLDKISYDSSNNILSMYSSLDSSMREETPINISNVEVDTTLTQSGKAADAKVVGDKLNGKVNVVNGKTLSTNDYTNDDKKKVDDIEITSPTNGQALVYDSSTQKWVNRTISSGGGSGQDGFSPTIVVTNITGGHRIAITDVDGTKTFDVMDGATGAKGDTGSKGDTGATGADGFSPTITVTNITGGHRVSITDVNGTKTFDVMDGSGSGGGTTTEVYYVTPEDYGAVGDGSTDDTNAISQAFNSGKPVVLTQGKTYFIQQLTVTHPLILIGNSATIATRSITIEEYNNGGQRMFILDDSATEVYIKDVNFYTTADQTIYGAHGDKDAAIPNRSIRCAIAAYGVDKLSVVNCTFTNFDTPINGQRHGSDTNYEYITNNFYLKDCRIRNSLMGTIGYFKHVVVDGCEIVEDANARSGEHCLYFLIDVLDTVIIANSAFYTHDGDCGSCIQFYIPNTTSTLPTGIKREYRIDGCLFFGDAFISNSGGGKCYVSSCTMKTVNYRTGNRRRQFECAITDGGVIEVTDSVVNLELQDRTDQALVFRNCNVYSTRLMGDRFSLYKAYGCQFDNISFNLSNNGEIIGCSFDSTVSVLGRYFLTVPSATTMSKVINCYFNAGQNVSAVAYGCAGTCYLVSPTSALPVDGGSNTGLNITNPIAITASGGGDGGDGGDDSGSAVIYNSTATIVASNPNYVSVSTNETINEGETWKVTWNGTEYICTPAYESQISGYYIGNPAVVGGTDDGSGATFFGYKRTSSQLAFTTTDAAGTITLKIEKIGSTWNTLYEGNPTIKTDSTGVNYLTFSSTDVLAVGDTYRVTWNGVPNTLTAKSAAVAGDTHIIIGNPGVEDGTDDGSDLTYYGYKYNSSTFAFGTTDATGTISLKVEKKTN